MLAEIGAVTTELDEDPRRKHQIHDVMTASLRHRDVDDSDDDDDDWRKKETFYEK